MVRRHKTVAPPAARRGQQTRQRRTERVSLNPARLPARLALHHQQRHLLRRAAKNGYADAQRALGYLYDKGLGLPRSYAKAYKWYARAALQVDETACNNIGVLYHDGKGVRRSKSLAKKWYKLAARAGSIRALSNLGDLYEDAGRLKKAVRYYRRAAEAGNKYAAKKLKLLDK